SGEAEADMIGLIEKYDLKDRVFILKGIDDETLIQFYNISDVFLLLSRQASDVNVEGFGIVFLEANACGLPVVAGNSGGIPDAVADGKSGFLVDPLDTQQIREKIIYLLQHPAEAKQMGEYGRKRVETNYNWPKITQDMLVHLNGIVKKT
ncbi:MAG: glycosyltransferase family 4 protein, partial [Calditrichaeota bacterium]|nr:glycosyltransferase family 4 protein [Calditrichota bacterium]